MKLKKIILNQHLVKIALLFVCFFTYIPPLHFITQRIFKFILIWGTISFAFGSFAKGKIVFKKRMVIFLLFLLSYSMTILYTWGNNSLGEIKQLLYCFTILFVIYPETGTSIQKSRFVHTLGNLYVFLTFFATTSSLFLYLANISMDYKQADLIYHIGIYKNRLYGIYNSPNVLGILALTSLLLSLGLMRFYKKYIFFHLINVVIQFCAITVTLSRGTQLSLLITTFFGSFFYCYRKYRNKKYFLLKRCFISLVFSCCVCVFVTGGSLLTNRIVNAMQAERIPSFSAQAPQKSTGIVPVEKAVMQPQTRIDTQEDVSSGRIARWKYAIRIFSRHILLGDGQKNTYINSREIARQEDKWMFETSAGGTHNIYIELLTGNGILGGALIILFLMKMAWFLLKYYFRCESHSNYLVLLWMGSILIAVSSNNLVESTLFYNIYPQTLLFWTLLEIVYQESQKEIRRISNVL